MKVHFVASVLNLKSNEHSFRKIEHAIEAENATVVRKWVDQELHNPITTDDTETWVQFYNKTKDYVIEADLIIAEITQRAFFVGFQVAMALNLKKPILILSKDELRSFKGMDEAEEIVKFATYTDDDVQEHISEFIDEYKDGNKSIRFNFFIDRKGLNYLNLTALNTGETKAQVIRRLLEEDREKG